MIRYIRWPRRAEPCSLFRAASLAAILTASFTPALAEEPIDLGALPTPQSMIREQQAAQQTPQLDDLENRIIAPLARTYGPQKYGIGALVDRLADLKKRAAAGEIIAAELSRLQADATQVKQRIAGVSLQSSILDDLDAREITPALNAPGPDKCGRRELYKRSAKLRQRLDAGEDISEDLAQLKTDARRASTQSWNDYKAQQGWK